MRYNSPDDALRFLHRVGVKATTDTVVVPRVRSLRVCGAVDYLAKSDKIILVREDRKEV